MQDFELASFLCDQNTTDYIAKNHAQDIRTKSKNYYSEMIKRFIRIEWLQEQSFCYEHQQYSDLTPIVTLDGLCYAFNVDFGMFNPLVWVDFISKTSKSWKTCFPRVSEDFKSNREIRMNCTDRSIKASKKKLTITVKRNKDEKFCHIKLFALFMQERTNFPIQPKLTFSQPFLEHRILKPTIYTADESLRSLSPKQWVDVSAKNAHSSDEPNLFKAKLLFRRRTQT